MTQTEFIILNFKKIRGKSIKIWKPDENAMTALEMIRHVLQADYGCSVVLNPVDMTNYKNPWGRTDNF